MKDNYKYQKKYLQNQRQKGYKQWLLNLSFDENREATELLKDYGFKNRKEFFLFLIYLLKQDKIKT